MSTTQPIKDRAALNTFKNYYLHQKPNIRNHALIILGLNTALRISDILQLRWSDLFNDSTQQMQEHLEVKEKKTGKINIIAVNQTAKQVLLEYKEQVFQKNPYNRDSYLFLSRKGKNKPLSRSQAFRIIKEAAFAAGLFSHVSCHSMRKTFGYHAWKQGTPPALLMDIYNHSSYKITKRYLCIEQDERDEVYRNILL
ncbi:tyrosine-type recombinase/integrase [Lachnospiraceae bacterium JLR.KK008]